MSPADISLVAAAATADMPGSAIARGLTSSEAERRLQQYGPNLVPEQSARPWLSFLLKFWAPVPWMLEAAIILQVLLGKTVEAASIAVLLLVNGLVGIVQEQRGNRALALLRARLTVQARVLRDERWQLLSARDLVPGDVIYLRMGDISPADARLLNGALLLDQSALTGESLPVEAAEGSFAYAGTVVRRGEAACEIAATAARTRFGRTAELVRTARTVSHLQETIFSIVKYLVGMDIVLVLAVLIYGLIAGMPWADVAPFALILLVASVPVALPATFALATALGAQELAKQGVLVTRLSAIEEAAAMDVLCCDKTGTITQNRLSLAALRPYGSFTKDEVLRLAALASDEATQDPIDIAILAAATSRQLLADVPQRIAFIPFDPETKRSEATYRRDGELLRVQKGAPATIADLVPRAPDVGADVQLLAAQGYRLLAVAATKNEVTELAGLLALRDPPREDAAPAIRDLKNLGVRVVMVTGDGLATALDIASHVGIGTNVCPHTGPQHATDAQIEQCDIFAGVVPQDKFNLVERLQRAQHVVGMTGDGVNDAPALKQAEVGIAVASATDVAKAAASIVLTAPGLNAMLDAVMTSRRIYQRMLTYTLNMAIKKFQVAFFLSMGLMFTGAFVATPLLIVIWMVSNDFITMTIATDRVSFSQFPNRWRVSTLILGAGLLAVLILVLSFGVFFVARNTLGLPLTQVQTLVLVMLVAAGQGTVYLVRERGHFWRSMPSKWLLLTSALDVFTVVVLATQGILMAPVRLPVIAGLILVVSIYLISVDVLKVRIFGALGVR
jgi:H+-transporting ATPase